MKEEKLKTQTKRVIYADSNTFAKQLNKPIKSNDKLIYIDGNTFVEPSKIRRQSLSVSSMSAKNITISGNDSDIVLLSPVGLNENIFSLDSCVNPDENKACDKNITNDILVFKVLFDNEDYHHIFYYKLTNCIYFTLRFCFYNYVEYILELNKDKKFSKHNLCNSEFISLELHLAILNYYYNTIRLKYPKHVIFHKIHDSITNIYDDFIGKNKYIKSAVLYDINKKNVTINNITDSFINLFNKCLSNECDLRIITSNSDKPCIKSSFDHAYKSINSIFSNNVSDVCKGVIHKYINNIEQYYKYEKIKITHKTHLNNIITNVRQIDDYYLSIYKGEKEPNMIKYNLFEKINGDDNLIF